MIADGAQHVNYNMVGKVPQKFAECIQSGNKNSIATYGLKIKL